MTRIKQFERPTWQFERRYTGCDRCGRLNGFYGQRDVETGWVGWCSVCNWWWWFRETPRKIKLGLCEHVASDVKTIQVTITSFLRGTLHEIKRIAILEYWRVILLGSPRVTWICCAETGYTREADSDDEDEDGVFPKDLDYVNPLHRLAIDDLKPKYADAGDYATVLSVVISFIGAPQDAWHEIGATRRSDHLTIGKNSVIPARPIAPRFRRRVRFCLDDTSSSRTCSTGAAAEFGIDL